MTALARRGLRRIWHTPLLAVALCTFLLLVTYDGVLRFTSPDELVTVGIKDGLGPFKLVQGAGNKIELGEPLVQVRQGESFGWVADITLRADVDEQAELEFVCDGRSYETRKAHFAPGARVPGPQVGKMALPPEIPVADCQLTRWLTLRSWYGIPVTKTLLPIHVRVVAR